MEKTDLEILAFVHAQPGGVAMTGALRDYIGPDAEPRIALLRAHGLIRPADSLGEPGGMPIVIAWRLDAEGLARLASHENAEAEKDRLEEIRKAESRRALSLCIASRRVPPPF